MANVFDTFSFRKWKDTKKDEEIDKESKRRRNEQVKRLKERLKWEREHREKQANNGDLDLDALIEALQRGEEINSGSLLFLPFPSK
uniref:Cir_N domain-containing protein n=1 Tax=Heterorhabditis bacteriophora TaxID=37862 RepID=A0A1I7X2U5_HETBA